MRISFICFGAVMALFPVGSALCASSPYTVVAPDRQAVAAANKWLSVMDASNYAQAYAMFPARIRSGGDAIEKQCIGYWRTRRTPLGRTLSRKFAKAYFGRTLQGSPDGYYEFLYYNTSFQHKAQAIESVTLTKESGHWQVSGYRFR
jgi:Protein of unknown function (DUF4019)